MSRIPTRRDIISRALCKLSSPSELRRFLEYRTVSGNEYPYFDLADLFPWLSRALALIRHQKLDIDSPVFLAGLRRSGSTLFYRIMNANSQLFLFNERFPGDRLNGRGTHSARNIYYSIDDSNSFHDIAARYLSPRLRTQYNRWGSKLALELAHPDHGSVSVPTLKKILAAFPGASVIGLVRDPRDFVLSALRRGGRDEKWWIDEYVAMMELFNGLQSTHTDSFLITRYEDLIDKTEKTVRRCCEFARLPFEKDMLDPSKWATKGPKEYTIKGIVARHGKWRMAEGHDLEIVRDTTEACFPLAADFGYVPE